MAGTETRPLHFGLKIADFRSKTIRLKSETQLHNTKSAFRIPQSLIPYLQNQGGSFDRHLAGTETRPFDFGF